MKIQLVAWSQDIGWRDSVRIGVSRLTALACKQVRRRGSKRCVVLSPVGGEVFRRAQVVDTQVA